MMNINISEPITSVATNLAQRSADGAIKEVDYLCCFNSYVESFEKEQDRLSAKLKGVEKDIEDSKKRNENRIEDEVQLWRDKANGLINIKDAKTKRKWFFGWCPDCIWQRRRGKELARKTLEITELIDRCNFNRVARPAEHPGIKYYSSQFFVDFESRKLVSKRLMEALEDENYYMIGLQGMGGTGKTTLATEVGNKTEESKIFDRVIFVVVSNPPDLKKIRGQVARQLSLLLEEEKKEEHSEILWSRIANIEGKVLIILDDVWEELNLRDIGIPCGHVHKNCCVLITTRDSKVCRDMGCQPMIQVRKLTNNDALNLFLKHADISDDDSSSEKNDVARKIVEECGGLPVAIVALARTLKNWPLGDWKAALTTLQNSEPLHGVHEDLTQVYRSLKLSYDNLKNDKARELFLLCSLFPEDYGIPIELLSKLGIGVGLFGEVNKYYSVRSQVIAAKNELIDSSLLLKDKEEYVKMHDLVREVALWITNEGSQAIMNSKTTLKANLRYLFWKSNNFPKWFDSPKLEILLLEVKTMASVEVLETFFTEKIRLRVLILKQTYHRRISAPSLSQSLQSLKDIRTLVLAGWILGDISILGNLQCLETLELENCLISELPQEIKELKKLKLLGLRRCRIGRNNPFQVIEKCSQLEELYFVGNKRHYDWRPQDETENKDEVPQNISLPELQRYYVAAYSLKHLGLDGPMSRCFNLEGIKDLSSEVMFKYLVGRAEILELGNMEETGWKNLIPDIGPMKDRGMNDLIMLSLYSLADIECLIDTRHLNSNSNVTFFSKLVELCFNEVDVKELYRGPMPPCFLKRLEILKLKRCPKLHSILFNGNFKLCHLKIMKLKNCPMLTSIFRTSTAQSLVQLEVLKVRECSELKYIIADIQSLGEEIVGYDEENSCGSPFPKLETLEIAECNKLELILPILCAGDLPLLKAIRIKKCKELKYIFGEYRDEGQGLHQNEEEIMFPSLEEIDLYEVPSLTSTFREGYKSMPSSLQRPSPVSRDSSMEKHPDPATRAFSWGHLCCFLPTRRHTNVVVSKATLPDHTILPELHASVKSDQTFHRAQCLLRQSLYLKNTREIELEGCSNLISLFTLSIATTILLEKLTIYRCHGLKQIITMEGEDQDHNVNHYSIFPKLETLNIVNCSKLGFIFPFPFSEGLQKLKSLSIRSAPGLKYVFGKDIKCIRGAHEDYLSSNENNNDELRIDLLPALEYLRLEHVPKIISICSNRGHLNLKVAKELHASMQELHPLRQPLVNLSLHSIKQLDFKKCSNLISLFSLPVASRLKMLEILMIKECRNLKYIVADEGDAQDHVNYHSIFPNLKELEVWKCQALEFLFPAHFLKIHLESLKIVEAPELKYVFGTMHHEDNLSPQNQNVDAHLDLPSLERLHLEGVPNLVSICPKDYYVTGLSLKIITLERCPQFMTRSFTDFMVRWRERQHDSTAIKAIKMRMQNLTYLTAKNFKIEEIFNLEGLERSVTSSLEYMDLQNLSELRQMCKGPKYILSLNNLRELYITECKKLRGIFCASTLRCLPQLLKLEIINCEKLVHIVEGDYEENIADDDLDQLCFPKLFSLYIKSCNSLKCLFSISTSGMLPNLWKLTIVEASELEQVFRRQEGDTQKLGVRDVFPNLNTIELNKLPSLVTICEGIDFQSVKNSVVLDCPKIDQDTTSQLQMGPENLGSESQAATEEEHSAHSNTDQVMSHTGEVKGRQELTKDSSNVTENTKEATKEIVEEVLISEISAMATSLSDSTSTKGLGAEETSMKIAAEDPTSTSDKQASATSLTESESRRASLHELDDQHSTSEHTLLDKQEVEESKLTIEIPQKTNIPCDNDSVDATVKERVQQGPSLEDAGVANPLADLASMGSLITTPLQEEFPLDVTKKQSSETIMTHQQALAETISVSAIENFPEGTTSVTSNILSSLIHSPPRPSSPSFKEIGKKSFGVVPASELLPMTTSPDFDVMRMASPYSLSISPHETPQLLIEPGSVPNLIDQQQAIGEAKSKIEIPRETTSIKETTEQGLQEHYATEEATISRQPTNSESRNQSRGSMVNPSEKEFAQSTEEAEKEIVRKVPISEAIKETRDASVEEGLQSKKAKEANLLTYSEGYSLDPKDDNAADITPSLHSESLQLMEFKDGEPPLLAKAWEQYPQLRLPLEQCTDPKIMALSLRVLVDILVMLATKTPCTITTDDKLTLAANLGKATFLGFDKEWIESVQAKVFSVNMDDFRVAEEAIQAVKDELEICDIALEHVKKEKVEVKERLQVVRRQLEMAQSEFEAIDAQLMSLLEDRKRLVTKMAELKQIVSANDRPFGF